MLVDEKIEIVVSNCNIKYYKNLGYNISNANKKIEIYIKDLPTTSKIKIKCKCKKCGIINLVTYNNYNRAITKYGFYTCKSSCSSEKVKQTCLEKYKVDSYSKTEEFLIKYKQTNLEKFGTEYCSQNNEIKEKVKQTCLEKYGSKCSLQNNEIKEKVKQTWINNYGVEHPIQNKNIHLKQQKNSLVRKKYKNTNLNYQGTYEKDFLNKYYNIIDIDSGVSIKYNFNNKEKVYFSDFYIKSKNLIIEIKSKYYYDLHLNQNLAKQKASISQGYNFIFIIDKNYNELNEKIKEK